MIATDSQLQEMFGAIIESSAENGVCALGVCACVRCNSCTCACSCRNSPENDDLEWDF